MESDRPKAIVRTSQWKKKQNFLGLLYEDGGGDIKVKYEILESSSAGNCTIIDDWVSIDMGVPWKTIEPYAKNLRLVLLTHIHG